MKRRTNAILKDHGDWLEVDVSTPKHPLVRMFIDKDDWDRIQKIEGLGRIHAWCRPGILTRYCIARIGKSMFKIHKLILNTAKEIDHKNGNGLDNRRDNIRPCTRSQNCMNKFDTRNTSGTAGVHWDKRHYKWIARIRIDTTRIFLGRFENKNDAIDARRKAEEKYFGEFAHV